MYCKSKFFLILIFSLLLSPVITAQKNDLVKLMPIPYKYEYMDAKFRLDKNFSISILGGNSSKLISYSVRAIKRLSGRTGLFFRQESVSVNQKIEAGQMSIKFTKLGKINLGENESYNLNITNSDISLKAETDLGAMKGIETLLQLLSVDETGYFFPAIKIEDKPRFMWRGLMIDAARHFMPVDVIKRNIDAMAAVKMNVLHLHLSDNQGVRVESKKYPKLQQFASDGEYYTQAQIKEIVDYAGERGLRVIPEFDIPWHSTAWFAAYPELGSRIEEVKIERNWGIFDPVFNPAIDATYNFFDNFFGEMAELFPDEYFHIGGDEGTNKEWNESKEVQQFMKGNNIANIQEMHNYFNRKILDILTKYGKKMVGWDEILQPGMPKNIVIQSWRGQKSLFESAKNGYMGILSSGYYIDLVQSAESHYLNDPMPDSIVLTPLEKEKILGGEATMWSELVTQETIDSRIWPRTAAIAERLWSPSSVKDVSSMYDRMSVISYQLEELGLTHIKNQDMMLRRLTNNNNIKAVKTILDYVEPLKNYSRHSQGVKYTSYSPYTRFVDAALPDAEGARNFRKAIDSILETKSKQTGEAKDVLTNLKLNHIEFLKAIKLSPILKEIEPLSENLSKLAGVGIESMTLLETGKTFSDSRRKEVEQIIKQSKKSYGQVEIMIVTAIEKLVKAASK